MKSNAESIATILLDCVVLSYLQIQWLGLHQFTRTVLQHPRLPTLALGTSTRPTFSPINSYLADVLHPYRRVDI